ncbi:unnamed protein product [Symbiodinium sp. CCMP2592]|nr:unnamed protein product [Symbiodinium sp. CCMP2592]
MYRQLLPVAVVMLLHCRSAAGSFQFASLTDLSSEQAAMPMIDDRASQIMEGDCEASCHVAGKLKRFWAVPAKLASSVARSIGKQIVTSMSVEDKATFSYRCGAYDEVCPESWILGKGDQLQSRLQAVVNLLAMDAAGWTAEDKAAFESEYVWSQLACPRSAVSTRLHGWAPAEYVLCNKRQTFAGLSPDEKRAFEDTCGVRFPCRSVHDCERSYETPCPRGWYSLDGGLTCVAPLAYSGNCSRLLDNAQALSKQAKVRLEAVCDVVYPCREDVLLSHASSPDTKSSPTPRAQLSLWFLRNGAIPSM